jgi:hypothetical protein
VFGNLRCHLRLGLLAAGQEPPRLEDGLGNMRHSWVLSGGAESGGSPAAAPTSPAAVRAAGNVGRRTPGIDCHIYKIPPNLDRRE